MTTLGTRWENPDYTGVIAEVPLGHVPHPKKFQPQNLQFDLRSQIECSGFVPFWQNMPIPETFNFALPRTSLTLELYRQDPLHFYPLYFWTVYSPVFGTRQFGKLAYFFAAID
jgi:hypothetical protein